MDEARAYARARCANTSHPMLSAALIAAFDELREEAAERHSGARVRRRLSDIIRHIVHEAHAEDLHAEHLVIAFHSVWDDLTGQGAVPPEMQETILIGALIAAFYEDQVTSGSDSPDSTASSLP